MEQYRQNEGGAEEKPLAGSYTTTFSNDNADFLTTYDGGPVIDPTYLVVKDGNHDPVWYLFNISLWDGIMDLSGTGFWPRGGEISHVSIYGSVGVPATATPEPATLLVWAGLAAISGLAVRRRRLLRAEL